MKISSLVCLFGVFRRSVLTSTVLGKWVRIPATYAGGAKGESLMAVIAFLIYVKIFRT